LNSVFIIIIIIIILFIIIIIFIIVVFFVNLLPSTGIAFLLFDLFCGCAGNQQTLKPCFDDVCLFVLFV
jgi:hypothetical protein